MKFLTEEVKDSIKLTSNQKAILATIAQGDDKTVADDVLAGNNNLSGALKQLIKMQMVSNVRQDRYTSSDLGKKYATEANIIDENGEITELGLSMVIGNDSTMKESVGTFRDYLELI